MCTFVLTIEEYGDSKGYIVIPSNIGLNVYFVQFQVLYFGCSPCAWQILIEFDFSADCSGASRADWTKIVSERCCSRGSPGIDASGLIWSYECTRSFAF